MKLFRGIAGTWFLVAVSKPPPRKCGLNGHWQGLAGVGVGTDGGEVELGQIEGQGTRASASTLSAAWIPATRRWSGTDTGACLSRTAEAMSDQSASRLVTCLSMGHKNKAETAIAWQHIDSWLPKELQNLAIVQHYHADMSREYLEDGLNVKGIDSVITYGIVSDVPTKSQWDGRAGRSKMESQFEAEDGRKGEIGCSCLTHHVRGTVKAEKRTLKAEERDARRDATAIRGSCLALMGHQT
ncbi:hypothetical protein FB451DRAFT_1367004 [Mycena latifolia]|nr:hypothetical protein FB451DRAFT_1367004 [Mycena latifolia]